MAALQDQIKLCIFLLIRKYVDKAILLINSGDNLIDDLQFDPMDVKYLIIKIENEFQIYFDNNEFGKIKTISDITNLVIKKKNLVSSKV
jgi:acyl carrier protein